MIDEEIREECLSKRGAPTCPCARCKSATRTVYVQSRPDAVGECRPTRHDGGRLQPCRFDARKEGEALSVIAEPHHHPLSAEGALQSAVVWMKI